MEENKKKIPTSTITRNTAQFSQQTENIYETVAMLSRRANQIAAQEKRELQKRIEEFATNNDAIEDFYENREQIDIVRHFEQMPKPVLTATEEYLGHELYYRNPAKEDLQQQMIESMENQMINETGKE